ncbi:hypothetical protein H6F93_08085 [Leptolyngbya sp. FACHB-671]|nr:hypothetical protein [Leptolyngbya sp. FACHB-671]MBD2067489.1 hypothetical protein [Leptolyngbya sp. FACHB-671]
MNNCLDRILLLFQWCQFLSQATAIGITINCLDSPNKATNITATSKL